MSACGDKISRICKFFDHASTDAVHRRCLARDALSESRAKYNPRFSATGIRRGIRAWGFAGAFCALLTLAVCGGGDAADSPAAATPTPTPAPVSAADAARLLEQATFGVTANDAYINEQLAYAPTQYTGYSHTPHTAPVGCMGDGSNPPDGSSLCARS